MRWGATRRRSKWFKYNTPLVLKSTGAKPNRDHNGYEGVEVVVVGIGGRVLRLNALRLSLYIFQ